MDDGGVADLWGDVVIINVYAHAHAVTNIVTTMHSGIFYAVVFR